MLGAVLVHPLLILTCFLLGCLSAVTPSMTDGVPAADWVQGGLNALGALGVVYVITFGIAPLVLSAVGAFSATWWSSALTNDPTG